MVKSFGEILKSHTRSSDASGRWSVEPTDPYRAKQLGRNRPEFESSPS